MGHRSTHYYCKEIIEEYKEYEEEDFEETTREERHWMKVAYKLAVALDETTGYKDGKPT
jgi:hypothetical protein